MTVLFLICVFAVVAMYFYYSSGTRQLTRVSPVIIKKEIINRGLYPKFNKGYSNHPGDVLLNPYTAPLRSNGYFPVMPDPRGIPINIKTRGFDASYRQTGILTRPNGEETILALMGRPLYANRNKWQYYTMSDKNNSVKLPVSRSGRSCTNEYGCDELYNGDTVYVEGYNDAFTVTVYDNYQPQYIPYI